MGLRLALGGDPARVLWTVAATSFQAIAAGVAASGAALAALAALLPELRQADWLLGAAAASALVLAGCAATLMAARGVISIPPARALQG